MSLSARIDGQELALPAGATVQMELQNPLLQDALQEEESTPLEVPAEGNELALEHVHQLPLAGRALVRTGGALGHGGLPLHTGDWHVLSSDERAVRLAFLREGFVRLTKGLTLPDCLRNEVLDLTDELLNQGMDFVTRPSYANGGKCQFPMFYAPKLYPSDARPLWMRTGSAWSPTSTYQVDALVEFTETLPVLRKDLWQCIAPTSAGESPATAPSKWRRTAQGIANAWDRANNTFYFNTVGGEFYTHVPWFYLKWVLERALAHVGYVPRGTWWDDAAWNELLLANTTTIDAPRDVTNVTFFLAQQSGGPVYFGGDVDTFRVPGQNELQDADGVWTPGSSIWTCPASGSFSIRATTTFNRPGNTLLTLQAPRVRGILYDDTGAVRAEALADMVVDVLPFTNPPVPVPGGMRRSVTFTFDCGAGDVGREFWVVMVQEQPGLGIVWPTQSSDAYLESEVRGWKNSDAPEVCAPDVFIYPHRHAPEVELSGFIQAVADAWNLEWWADATTRTVWLNSRERVLDRLDHERTDASDRLVGSVELDHERRTTGVVLSWGVDTTNESAERLANAQQVLSTTDLPTPLGLGDTAIIRSTRELLKSRFDPDAGAFYWVPSGYHVPDHVQGERATATTVGPAMVPLQMVRKLLDGKEYMMPVLEAEGTSAWFHTEGERDTVWITLFQRARSSDGAVTNVPCARTWQHGWTEADSGPASLLWDGTTEAPGLVQRQWEGWISMLLRSEPVTMDLLIDHAFIRGRQWTRVLHMHGQDYLVQTMPVEYGATEHLMSRGAYLLRLRQPTGTDPLATVPEPEACENPAEVRWSPAIGFVLIQGAEVADTHFAVAVDGAEPVLTPKEETLYLDPAAGNVRAYACDAEGTQACRIIQVIIAGGGGIDLDLSDAGDMLSTLQADGVNTLVMPPAHTLTGVWITESALDEATVDALLNSLDDTMADGIVDLSGGTTAAPSAASLAKRKALLANGWTITTN